MPRSKHHRKRRTGTKKRGRRGGLAYPSAVSPELGDIPSQMPKSTSVPMQVSAAPPAPPRQVSTAPPPRQVSSAPPSRQVSSAPPSRPVVPSNKSFRKTMQRHLNTAATTATTAATNAANAATNAATNFISRLMGNPPSGGRKSRRRTHKRRRSTRGFKKGTKSKTHRGRKNFTTKRGNKVFHRRGHYVRLNRAPYRKKK